MRREFGFSEFVSKFQTDELCLEEIKKLRYPNGVYCKACKKITRHYKIKKRISYTCKFCRTQLYPLKDTIFEKTATPLRLWFYAMFLMTYTRADISIRDLQRELGVTYKTAWRMFTAIKKLMAQNNGDLLTAPVENNLLKWTFFNRFEIKVVEKKEIQE